MTLKDIEKQIIATKSHLEKALIHLEYSLSKIEKISKDYDIEDFEILETFESFTSRFSRVSDIMAKKLVRSLVLRDDPSFSGGLMDFLNQGEKLAFISDANHWWVIRSLRNKEAHEYTEEDLRGYFSTIKTESIYVIDETRALLKKL
jgi:hypothetical protein